MGQQLLYHLRKSLLFILVICMTVCQLTPIRSTYALEDTIEEAEVVVLGEDVSLREESSKTFILSDKTYQKVIYSIPVHYEENGEWKEIDNTFIDDGLSYVEDIETYEISEEETEIESEESVTYIEVDSSLNQVSDNESSEVTEEISEENQSEVIESEQDTNEGIDVSQEEVIENEEIIEVETPLLEENNQLEVTETEDITEQTKPEVVEETIEVDSIKDNSQVVGYKNKNGNLDIKVSKKVHQKNMVSIQDDEYKVTWGFKDLENKSYGVVANPQILDDPIEAAYNHIAQQITYSDVISGVDLVYNIDSLSIKENIVIKQKVDINEFTFEYKVNGLQLVLNDEGDIEADNENDEVIFLMPKPYMYDKEGNYCHDVHYEISEKNKKYTITIIADEEWLNSEDRVYPITIDPVIQTQQTSKAIKSTFIASDTDYDDTNFDTHFELLVGRESSAYHNCRSLFKFSLPTLNRGDMVVDAKFYVAQYYQSFYTGSTADLQINAHMINTSWADTSVTWNSIKGSGSADSYYDNTILDYDFIKKTDVQNAANWKVFDVTSAVKEWYNGTANNGILLKSYNEAGSHEEVGVKGTFWPEDYNNSYNAFPYLLISYRNNKGIESYYDYTSFSTYSAGNVFIDNYSGNLVIEHVDASTYGNKAPISVSHIYNGYMADNNAYYTGKGWKLNVHQTLLPSSNYGLTGESATTYPYVYMDQDGTEHYFIKKDSQYFDEDGLGLELKVISGGYTITDKKDNVMTFNSSGNITSIKDVNNNTINFTYSGNKITKVTSGNGQAINLTYDSSGNLNKITDQAGKVTTYTYSNNLLTQVTYDNGKTSSYSYDSNSALQTMTSYDSTSITFSYTTLASGKQVSQIVEKGSDGSNGQTIKFDRSLYNTTIITTSGVDSVINTSDDVKTELQFDNAGRLMSTHSYTDSKDLGASIYEFTSANPNTDNSNLEALNKLNKVGSLGANIMDLAVNTSGDSTDTWSSSSSVAASTFTFGTTTEESLFGTNSFKLTSTSCALNGRARFYQNHNTPFAKANTTYTASAYIKTDNIQPVSGAEDYGAAILIFLDAPSLPIDEDPEAADFASEYIIGTTDEQINDGWRRVSVTFTTPADIETIRFNCMIRNATGTAYFDGIQLEQSQVANPNNLLVNACFERTTSKFPRYWTKSGITSTDIADTTIKHSGDRSIKVTSSVNQTKEMYQTVNVEGTEQDTYILSGWSYGKGVDKGIDSTKYELIAKVTYTDGTSVWKESLKFNTSISGWKYVSQGFDLSDGTSANKTPASITVYARSYGQPNTVYFDNIQLIQTEVTTCEYDDEGNMISSNGSSYEYQDGDLIKVTDKEGKETTYTYNTKHQQTSMTTPNGIKTSSVYDGYGNITSTTITNSTNSQSIKTETVYDSTNSFVSETKDEDGYTTSYDYNELLGLIESITDAKNNSTNYTYDTNDLLTEVLSDELSVQYVYDTNHRLSEIQTATDDYQFTYDAYGNRTTTKINNTTLASYNYQNYNGYVSSISYNNGYTETYVYDEYGNLVETYENNVLVSKNLYDSNGTPIQMIDYKTNEECVYEYDHKGRLVRIIVSEISSNPLEDTKVYEIAWGYDDLDRLICESRTINGQTSKQVYTYDNKQLLNQLTLDSNVSLNYEYDAFERINKKTIDTQGSDIQTSYTYATSQRGSNFTTSKVQTETIGDTSYHYTYDEVGNITQIVMTRGSTTKVIQYEYDANSQLIRENNQQTGLTTLYYYDGAGNIADKTIYPYSTEEELRSPITMIDYSYGGTNQLASYNYSSISYDSLGNPINYLGKTMSWEGRQLKTVNSGSNSISYTYNSDGLRRTKTVNGQTTVYEYSGTQLIHEQRPTYDLYYQYDESGNLVKITKKQNNSTTNYYVATNIRGDVEAIYNENGQIQARYVYDAWGKVASVLDANNHQITDTNHIGHINPFRYRGYYYDTETSFYYLQSRYYDPEVGRFISADGQISDIGGDVLGYNLYTYCMNNPVNMSDEFGTWPSLLKVLVGVCAIVIGAALVAATAATGGAATAFVGAVSVGLKAAVASGLVGATVDAVTSAVSHRVSTGSWTDVDKVAIEGAVDGFVSGFMTGGIMAGGSQILSSGFKAVANLGVPTGRNGGLAIGNNVRLLSPNHPQSFEAGGTLLKIGSKYKNIRFDVGSNSLFHMNIQLSKRKNYHLSIGILGSGLWGGIACD